MTQTKSYTVEPLVSPSESFPFFLCFFASLGIFFVCRHLSAPPVSVLLRAVTIYFFLQRMNFWLHYIPREVGIFSR